MRLSRVCLATLFACASCAGAGPYGYSPHYVEVDEEAGAVAGASGYEPEGSARSRSGSLPPGRQVVLFGVVEARQVGSAGRSLLKLGVHALAPRNLCTKPGDDGSCRVTVEPEVAGVVWVAASLRSEDDVGPNAIARRSLVRVVGTVEQEVSASDGAPVVRATWYRQWPAREYVVARPGDRPD